MKTMMQREKSQALSAEMMKLGEIALHNKVMLMIALMMMNPPHLMTVLSIPSLLKAMTQKRAKSTSICI